LWIPAASRLFGWPAADIVGNPNPTIVDTESEADEASSAAAFDGSSSGPREVDRLRRDGSVVPVRQWVAPLRRESGEITAVITILQDLTSERRADIERDRLHAALDAAEALVITDPEGQLLFANRRFAESAGAARLAVGRVDPGTFAGVLSPEEQATMARALADGRTWVSVVERTGGDGATLIEERTVVPVADPAGELIAYVGLARDVTRERSLEARVASQTDLAGALDRMTPGATPEATAEAICREIVSLPGFGAAAILAFGAGDVVTPIAVVGPPQRALVAGRTIPRLRGRYLRQHARSEPWSEAWQPGPAENGYGAKLASAGLRAVAYAPLRGDDGPVGLLAVGSSARDGLEQLTGRLPEIGQIATLATALLAPSLQGRIAADDLSARIRKIIEAKAFWPVFQPIVALESGDLIGYEALTRFDDGLPPDLRFSEAEAAGLGKELELACLAAAINAARDLDPLLWLSLNVSPDLLLADDLLGGVLAAARQRVEIEITEHVAIDDYAVVRDAVIRLGPSVHLAVDDAGAGHASLRHILELRPASVKLDLGLTRSVDVDQARQAMIAGMSHFATSAGCRLVAEGIETEAERQTLLSLGVQYGQGYLFGRPAPINMLGGVAPLNA
jgi:PAS domain S-box-containing protein